LSVLENTVSQSDAVSDAISRFNYNIDRPWGLYGIDTGIHPLNMAIGGWIPKKLTVIAARSGHGKTGLTPQIFQAGSRVDEVQNRRAAFLFPSWETSGDGIVDRHVCNTVGVTMKQLTQGAKLFGPKTIETIRAAYEEARTLPVLYQPMSLSINELSQYAHEFAEGCLRKSARDGIKTQPVIVIDYVGLARFTGKDIRAYDVGDFINGCKRLANDISGSVVAFVQIKRSSDEKAMPDRNDISDAQSIEQAADNLIILHRPEYNNAPSVRDPETGLDVDPTGKALLRILKARDYGTGDRLIGCDIKYYRFYDLKHPWDFEYWHMYRDPEFWLAELGAR
jgi:replicative DNA helicase